MENLELDSQPRARSHRTESGGTEVATAVLLPGGLWGPSGYQLFYKNGTSETGNSGSRFKCPHSRLAFLEGEEGRGSASSTSTGQPSLSLGRGRSPSLSPTPTGLPGPSPGVLGPGGVRVCLVAKRPAALPNSLTTPRSAGAETGLSFLIRQTGLRRARLQSRYADGISACL